MRWQRNPKMNFLLPVFVILGSLHGAAVKNNWDWVLQEDPIDVNSTLSEKRQLGSLRPPVSAPSAEWLSVKSITSPCESAAQAKFSSQMPAKGLRSQERNCPSAKSTGPDGEESSHSSSIHVLDVIPKFVSTNPPEITYLHLTNPGADAIGLSSTGHFLPTASIGDEKSTHKVTTSVFKLATQVEFKSKGAPKLDIKCDQQDLSLPNHAHLPDAMELHTRSSEEVGTGNLASFEPIETRPSVPSIVVSSSPGSEPTSTALLQTNTVSGASPFVPLSTSDTSEDGQTPDVPEDGLSAPVSINWSPDVSDTSSDASFVSVTQAPDLHDTSMAASDVSAFSAESPATNQVPDASNKYFMASSDSPASLPDPSEEEYATFVPFTQDPNVSYPFSNHSDGPEATSVSAQWWPDASESSIAPFSFTRAPDVSVLHSTSQTPDVSTSMATSISEGWLLDVPEYTDASTDSVMHIPDVTATTAASICRDQTLNVIELYFTSQTADVSDRFSTDNSVLAAWTSDVSDYTAANLSPDHSEYSSTISPLASEGTAVSDACSFTTCVSPQAPVVSAFPTAALGSKWSLVSEYATASSVSSVQDADVSDTYTTAASGHSDQSSNGSDPYSASQTARVSTYSRAASSTQWLADVSQYSTAASSVSNSTLDHSAYSTTLLPTTETSSATNQAPNVSDVNVPAFMMPGDSDYSTAAASVASWMPDVWLVSNSEVGTSTTSPHTVQTTLRKSNSTEQSASEKHPSATLSPTDHLPSEALLLSPIWRLSTSGKPFTSLSNASYFDPLTSSPTDSIHSTPSSSPFQPSTKAAAIGPKPSASTFTLELADNASLYLHTEHSTTITQAPFLLQFTILNQSYADSLSDRSSEDYKELETVVKRTLNAIFHARYGDDFLGIEMLGFRNGSVEVECEVVFQEMAAVPSSSDIVRTVVTHVYNENQTAPELRIDVNSVTCNGFSLSNLEPARLLIEFTALSIGFGPWFNEPTFLPDLLQRLTSWVVTTLEEKYLVQEFNVGRVTPLQGDVNIQGIALLSTPVHIDKAEALALLNNLVNRSVDLRSLKVNGFGENLGVLPVSFAIKNRVYNATLKDSRSAYFCSLGKAVTEALQVILKPKYSHFVQAVIKQFGHGSVILTSYLVFRNAPPDSHEVLDVFFNLVNEDDFLSGTDFKVDAYSFTVGDAKMDRPFRQRHFPAFGIALIVLFGLGLIALPVVAFLCWKCTFCAACQERRVCQEWDVEQEIAGLQLPLPEIKQESYRLHEGYANSSIES